MRALEAAFRPSEIHLFSTFLPKLFGTCRIALPISTGRRTTPPFARLGIEARSNGD